MTWKLAKGIWLNFMQAVENLKISTLMGSFCPKHIKFWWKRTEELCLMTLKSDAKFEEKLTLGSKNGMRNLINFNASSGKSKNLHFDVLLFSVAYKVSASKGHKIYFSWHWRVIQTLKKNWFFVWKITWGVWWILTWPVESLKICTLIDYFCQKYVMFEIKKYRGVVLWKMT